MSELGERAIATVGRLLEAHRDEGDLSREAELNDEIIQVCELLDYYQMLSEVRCKPLQTRPQAVQVMAALQAMASAELEPFVRAARELGRKDRTSRKKFSLRRLVAQAGYSGGYRTQLLNIEKRHRQYSYGFRDYLKACYEAGRNPLDPYALRESIRRQRVSQSDNRPDNISRQESARNH